MENMNRAFESDTTDERCVERAAEKYLRRKARIEHPSGKWDGKRWEPSEDERRACCDCIRAPSRAYPWSLMLHCRTVTHIARLCDVDEAALRALLKPQRRAVSHAVA